MVYAFLHSSLFNCQIVYHARKSSVNVVMPESGESSMVTEVARRVIARPKLDEPCPSWARSLIPLSQQEHGLGVPRERIPQATLDELAYYFPLPADPKRRRKRGPTTGHDKTYTRTSGLTVYLGCLPFALAKQLDLFALDSPACPGEVAVLSFRKLADLAKRLGISYDRLQRQMTVLITLGFIWRFRSGKQLLYVIPLAAYRPNPSPEAVREKLTALIESQLVEVRTSDGTLVRRSRCPDFTDLLVEIRALFELRYRLEPSVPAAGMALLEGPAWETMLRDIQSTLPHCTREELTQLVPIIARHLVQQGRLRGNQGGGRHWVLRSTPAEATLSIQEVPDSALPFSEGRLERRDMAGTMDNGVMRESRNDHPYHRSGGTNASDESISGRKKVTAGKSGQSGFVPGKQPGSTAANACLQAAREPVTADSMPGTNPDCATAVGSLTLRVISSHNYLKENTDDNVKDAPRPSANPQQDEEWCQAQGASLAKIFSDFESLNYYVGVHRVNEPDLLRAVYIKTLYQASHGGFKKSPGAYFNFMLETWRVYRTYEAACAKWNHWGNKRDPKGIPPNVQQLVALHRLDSYEQIATSMGYDVDESEQDPWLTSSPPPERLTNPMSRVEAEQLVERIQRQAAWYLQDPQVVPEPAFGAGVYVVDAIQNDGWVTFTSREAWDLVHEWMLTPPARYEGWFAATAQERQQALVGVEDGLSAEVKEQCVRAALALSVHLGWDVAAFSWRELMALGKPLAFRAWEGKPDQEETVLEPSSLGPQLRADHNGLQVRLDDGVVLTMAAYERAFQMAEMDSAQEEWEASLEGAIALLQHEWGLALQLCILRTFGLPMYQAFLACSAEVAMTGASEAGERGAEGQQRLPITSGHGYTAVSLASYRRLSRALDPGLYRVIWKPDSEEQGGAIKVESLLSGTVFIYKWAAQVDELLADLSAQLADE
jgi:hypothetical protein